MQGNTELSEKVIGAAIEVHQRLGSGFLEKTYERAMAIELKHLGIAFELQVPGSLMYRNESIGDGFVDILLERDLVVELKTCDTISDGHKTQVLVYLEALDKHVALVINFHAPRLADGIRRVIR